MSSNVSVMDLVCSSGVPTGIVINKRTESSFPIGNKLICMVGMSAKAIISKQIEVKIVSSRLFRAIFSTAE